jgi:RNA polymerase sigma-70 factor, ECF subfamily
MTQKRPAVSDGAEISDGDLVALARDGDPLAFRLLVERHQRAVRNRAASLGADPGDVDDIMQESFLQAFLALDRLRDPDRFAAWLAGITANVARGLRHRDQAMLVPDWPESLHPATVGGLSSAEDLDRANALRAAMASLPAGQRRAIALHYYADLPAAQIGDPAGAAWVSLHKARRRLRAYLTQHRPDLVPAVSRRPQMTTVRIARADHCAQAQRALTHIFVLEDGPGRRELPLWLRSFDGNRLQRLLGSEHEQSGARPHHRAGDLAGQLLDAIGAAVTGVEIGELGPEVIATRITVTGPAGARKITATLADGLAVAITTAAPVRVADAVMDRLAVPVGTTTIPDPGPPGLRSARPHRAGRAWRPRYEPRNLMFAGGLDGWRFGGSFTKHASQSHWHDYACATEHETALIFAAVPEPAGFAFLGQEVFADDYRGSTVIFRAEVRRTADGPGRAGLFLHSPGHLRPYLREPRTERIFLADPDNALTEVPADSEWARHEAAAEIPVGCDRFLFGIALAGPGRIELRNAELVRRT